MTALASRGFWTPEPVLYHARAEGFAFFDAGHLLLLSLSAALVAVVLVAYLRWPAPPRPGEGPFDRRLALLRVTAAVPVALVALKCATYLALGLFEPPFWPLHACNLCEFAALAYALAPRSRVGERCADLLFCWGLVGCAGALLFPGWNGYCPALCAASLCGFVEHALVLACALCVVAGGEYVPRPRGLGFVLLASVSCGLVFRAVNPLWGTNFFFVTDPSAVGGPFPWLADTFGDPGFLVPYLALVVASWVVAYGVCRLSAHLRT